MTIRIVPILTALMLALSSLFMAAPAAEAAVYSKTRILNCSNNATGGYIRTVTYYTWDDARDYFRINKTEVSARLANGGYVSVNGQRLNITSNNFSGVKAHIPVLTAQYHFVVTRAFAGGSWTCSTAVTN